LPFAKIEMDLVTDFAFANQPTCSIMKTGCKLVHVDQVKHVIHPVLQKVRSWPTRLLVRRLAALNASDNGLVTEVAAIIHCILSLFGLLSLSGHFLITIPSMI
jgi:hypothetical protein